MVTRQIILASAFALALATTVTTRAADQEHEHPPSSQGTAKMSDGSQDLHMSMMKGMKEMQGMKMSGDMDHDFASMMIKHHEQAIEMAQAELDHGKSPEVQKTAREIISASQKDIQELKKFMAQHHQ
ncbi:MAG TPA: DUF305 domain-containing protein [Steroidobacteraceae bacterium]|nr:DUF305 domain-containing protein [Steroidobacteraceae bacterium]